MRLVNETRQVGGALGPPWPHAASAIVDERARTQLVVAVRITWSLDTNAAAASEDQEHPVLADRFSERGALDAPSDLVLRRSGTNVVVRGHVVASPARRVTEVPIALRVGIIASDLVLSGAREWRSIPGGGYEPSQAAPIDRIALTPALAFGGAHGNLREDRNPLGKGLWDKDSNESAEGLPLPEIEHVAERVSAPSDRPSPALWCPIAPHWMPRYQYAGTYDELWRARRAPFVPRDFNVRFWDVVPEAMVHRPFLRGGETIRLVGLGAPIEAIVPRFELRLRCGPRTVVMPLVTLAIDADTRKLALTYSGSLEMPKVVHKGPAIHILEKRVIEHGRVDSDPFQFVNR
jgi:hypothetical protein